MWSGVRVHCAAHCSTSPSSEQAADPSVHGHGQWRGAARRGAAAEQRRRGAAARAQPNTKRRRGVGDSLLPTTPTFLPRPRSALALLLVSAWA
jgi:hypothetical protein